MVVHLKYLIQLIFTATLKALRMYIIKVMFRIIKTICKLYTITDILFLRLKKMAKMKNLFN